MQHKLGFTHLGSSSGEKGPGVLVHNKLNRSEQCTAVAKKDQRILGSIKKASPAEVKEVIIPLYSVFVMPPLEYYVPFWSLLERKKKDADRLDRVQRRAKKMIKELESLPCEERLRAGLVQPGEMKVQGRPYHCVRVLKVWL